MCSSQSSSKLQAEAEEATKADDEHIESSNCSEVCDVIAENAPTKDDHDQLVEVTEEVATKIDKDLKSPLLITDVDDEICSDEEYYEEIDPGSAFTCLQCQIEHYPENFVEGSKVLFYGLCRWHLGVYKCKNCLKNLIGLSKIRDHRQIWSAPS